MKIPTSSSLILATLAISSSSTSLAAPTGDGPTDNGMSSSHSNGRLSASHTSRGLEMEERADMSIERSEDLQERNLLQIVHSVPLVGPILTGILEKTSCDSSTPSSRSVDDHQVSQDELMKLQSAVDTVSGALSGILPISPPVAVPPLPIGAIASNAPVPLQSAIGGIVAVKAEYSEDNASLSSSSISPNSTEGTTKPSSATAEGFLLSPTTTIANAEAIDPTSSASSYSASASASGAPSSPGVPPGPPNTPALPINHLPV